ncbi:MAG: recombination protein RecR [Candidatus Latescibacteria bacterium]|nr:recombination protein RecR [Candidatus Latescibacterota bacterium]NIM21143.1 recombination protein RecR [Candidatus Latescibacterota bacterium]NIM65278.1 recombination protein RecR [Candidatus Latescibacterota bacterium]NIO01793.1 recombination protein RecR [Candidatus Latescibacterota bacterium]NIO28310.1 recombination protein RecR [Candidatus Latescibacterota bacterium]
MDYGSETLSDLIRSLARLPGIGTKTAQRLALHLLKADDEEAEKLGNLIASLREKVRFCKACGSITEKEECAICMDPSRNREIICVVEGPQDVLLLEKTRHYKGLYHVLHGVLSPIDGIGPENLNLAALEQRVKSGEIKEVIVATNPTVEGDTTALYIAKTIEPYGCTVTRLARGLPMGGSLEFADDMTIASALERREKI